MKVIILVVLMLGTISCINVSADSVNELKDCKKMNGESNWSDGLVINLQEDCKKIPVDCNRTNYSEFMKLDDIQPLRDVTAYCSNGG
jgi:hypothetical protein